MSDEFKDVSTVPAGSGKAGCCKDRGTADG